MIYVEARLSWPWFKDIEQTDYIEKTWKVSKNKSLEVQLSRGGKDLIGFDIRFTMRQDHAGLMLNLDFLRYFFVVNFYDGRHWNYEKNRYVNYDDPQEVEDHG